MSNIKEAFISKFGDKGLLVELDLVQLEVMALAEITGDPVLITELNSGVDIHRMNAAQWLKKDPKLVTDEERKRAKVMTFQLTYGAGYKRMAEDLGVPEAETQQFITSFMDKYTEVKEFHGHVSEVVVRSRIGVEPSTKVQIYAPSLPTKRLYSCTMRQSDFGTKPWSLSPTELKNYPVQGFATGDMVPLILNMILDNLDTSQLAIFASVGPEWRNERCNFVNTIHDSGMLDCHEDYLARLLWSFEYTFRNLKGDFKELFDYELKLNYNYSIKLGPNWKDTVELSRKDVQEILKK